MNSSTYHLSPRFNWVRFEALVVQRFVEVTQLVSHQFRLNMVEAVWEGLAEELRDLQISGDQEWAQEGAPHLHTAITSLMQGLWLRSEAFAITNTMEEEGREP